MYGSGSGSSSSAQSGSSNIFQPGYLSSMGGSGSSAWVKKYFFFLHIKTIF